MIPFQFPMSLDEFPSNVSFSASWYIVINLIPLMMSGLLSHTLTITPTKMKKPYQVSPKICPALVKNTALSLMKRPYGWHEMFLRRLTRGGGRLGVEQGVGGCWVLREAP